MITAQSAEIEPMNTGNHRDGAAVVRREQASLALTMIGITIGVFSVISVMTAIGALSSSIESGISFLGSNFFQFAMYPISGGRAGATPRKYENRRNISYAQAFAVTRPLMEGVAPEVCLKTFLFKGRRLTTACAPRPASTSRARTRAS
jgi:hypothetical protein